MTPNWIDKAVSFMDPQAGLKRMRARAAAEGMLRYEGAQRGRRTANWFAPGTSANAEIGPDLPYLRSRSRDLERNNPLIRKALRVLVSNTVGGGIRPEADTGNASLNAAGPAEGRHRDYCRGSRADEIRRLPGAGNLHGRRSRLGDAPDQVQTMIHRYVRNRRAEWLFITAFVIALGFAIFAEVMARFAS